MFCVTEVSDQLSAAALDTETSKQELEEAHQQEIILLQEKHQRELQQQVINNSHPAPNYMHAFYRYLV